MTEPVDQNNTKTDGDEPTKANDPLDFKDGEYPEAKSDDEPVFFDGMVAKLVERENEQTGEKEWVEVLSDNLFPGEKLKRQQDDEQNDRKSELEAAQVQDKTAKRREAEDEVLKTKRAADTKAKK